MSAPEDDPFAKTHVRVPTPVRAGQVATLEGQRLPPPVAGAPATPPASVIVSVNEVSTGHTAPPASPFDHAPAAPAAAPGVAVPWKDEHNHGDPLIGQTLGDYVIRERLGQGGMGLVYKGEQPMIGKRVAIKVLRPEIARDPEQVQRLLSEARAVNSIRHRGIIDIFNFGQLPDGRHYVVMEYLAGRALDDLISRRGALPPVEGLELLDEVLAALGAGHEAGIIHRDLKPSNIFLVSQPDGSTYVKLLDFGLAKQSATPRGATPQTRTDMFVGTPEYVAPEQARAEIVGPYTDLYACGVVAFEIFTGRLPFEATTAIDWVVKHLEAKPPAPSEHAGGIPAELDALVLRMLEKDPKKRPESAEVIRRELSRIKKLLASQATQLAGVMTPLPGDPTGPATSASGGPVAAKPLPAVPAGPSARREATTQEGLASVQRSKLPLIVIAVAGVAITAGVIAFAVGSGPKDVPVPAPASTTSVTALPTAPATQPIAAIDALAPAATDREKTPPAPAVPATTPTLAPTPTPPESTKRTVEVKQVSVVKSARPPRDVVPSKRDLVREINRLDRRIHTQARGEAPSEPVLALLKGYREEAKRADMPQDRLTLANKLASFERQFILVKR